MFFHSIRRASAGIVAALDRLLEPNDYQQQQDSQTTGFHELDNIGYRANDPHDMVGLSFKVNGDNTYAKQEEAVSGDRPPPLVFEAQPHPRSSPFGCISKLREVFSVEFAIIAIFSILFTTVLLRPSTFGIKPAFQYPVRFNLTEVMKICSQAQQSTTTELITVTVTDLSAPIELATVAADLITATANDPTATVRLMVVVTRTTTVTAYDQSATPEPETAATATIPGFFLMPRAIVTAGAAIVGPTIQSSAGTTDLTEPNYVSSPQAPVLAGVLRGLAAEDQSVLQDSYLKTGAYYMHHAYPLHAPQPLKSEEISVIKAELEKCAYRILGKFEYEGIKPTSGLEFLLHDCKAAIDGALGQFYRPRHFLPRSTDTDLPIRDGAPDTDPYIADDTIDDDKHTSRSVMEDSDECVWVRPRSFLTGRECSNNFCDWMGKADLSRCYEENMAWLAGEGGNRYLNDSVDDFKTGAPIECNLCLPKIDCWGIDTYCHEVEAAELAVLQGLLVLLVILLLVCSGIILAKR